MCNLAAIAHIAVLCHHQLSGWVNSLNSFLSFFFPNLWLCSPAVQCDSGLILLCDYLRSMILPSHSTCFATILSITLCLTKNTCPPQINYQRFPECHPKSPKQVNSTTYNSSPKLHFPFIACSSLMQCHLIFLPNMVMWLFLKSSKRSDGGKFSG
jgi:hypothetical protein